MPRRARMYIAGTPYHVVQRGNNRTPCFGEAEDQAYYLKLLGNKLSIYGVKLHAYVLMSNHVHFLMTPEDPDSISNLTRVLGSRFAAYINKKYQRTGTLWEGRHKSSPVDSERYLLTCYRYIELNPVRAGICSQPEDYPWSSYRTNASLSESTIISPHDVYLRLGSTRCERARYYRELFPDQLHGRDLEMIRNALHFCHPLGDEAFRNQLAIEVGRPLGQMIMGRPRKTENPASPQG